MTPGLSAAQEAIRTSAPVRRAVVRAVAGAGKTRLLIERAQYLVGQGVPEDKIWFLVFTVAARQELQSRLERAKLRRCRVMTLHRLCLEQLGGERRVTLLDDRHPAWRAILAELQLTHTRFRDLGRELERIWQRPLAELSPDRRRLREDAERRLRALDRPGKRHITFTGLLAEVQALWARDELRLRAVQAQVEYVIVDEVQDISAQQLALLETLAGPRPLLAVGDPWQGIFSFQGAVPQVMDDLMRRAQVYPLETTHRSPAQHTLVAEALTGQRLVPARGFAGSLAVYHLDSRVEAADTLQAAVRDLLERGEGERVAVLVATNREVAEVTALLHELHLPVRTSTRTSYAQDRFCRRVLWPAVAYLTGRRQPRGRHPLAALDLGEVSLDTRDLLHAAWRTERHVSAVREVLPEPGLRAFFDLWAALDAWTGPVSELPSFLTGLVPGHHSTDEAHHLCRRVQDLDDLAVKLGAATPEEEAQVVVSTIHGAKGREWSGVVVYDAGPTLAGGVPADEDLAEATRLRYVALTRAWRDLVAVLHRDCHPVYAAAFDPAILARIWRLEAAFTGGATLDEDLVAADLRAAPSIRTYLQDHGPADLPEHRQAYLEGLLGLESAARAAGPAPVQRVPLAGLLPGGR